MAEPVRIVGHKKGVRNNEQLQAQVIEGASHNALAIAPVSSLGIQINPATEDTLQQLVFIPTHDETVLGWTGSDLTTITYKLLGTTVATLTLTYSAGVLQGIVKT